MESCHRAERHNIVNWIKNPSPLFILRKVLSLLIRYRIPLSTAAKTQLNWLIVLKGLSYVIYFTLAKPFWSSPLDQPPNWAEILLKWWKKPGLLMQPLDAVTMALFDGHYAGLVLTWKSGMAKKKTRFEVLMKMHWTKLITYIIGREATKEIVKIVISPQQIKKDVAAL